jgi:ankyrin repeat protein
LHCCWIAARTFNARNDRGATPLHRAIGFPQVAQLLLERGASVDATDDQGRTALHWAANDPKSQAIAVLIRARPT